MYTIKEISEKLKIQEDTLNKIKYLLDSVCTWLDLDKEAKEKEFEKLLIQIENYPNYIPNRVFSHIDLLIKSTGLDTEFENIELEKIVCNNFIFGDFEKFIKSEIRSSNWNLLNIEDSIIYKNLIEGVSNMRVNVLHPRFLSDQHLIAEYREVKMGPKALSKSLYSKNGVDKKRINPVYTLNTGHTYFFYDKNGYLEGRLARLVAEMQQRGIETNFTELIDDKYDYHPDTFNDEFWNNWQPDEAALNINLERINQRFSIKQVGWYKFWGRPVLDMNDLISSRAQNSFWECPNCRAIHVAPEGDNWVCWNCCSKIPADTLKVSYFNEEV